MAVQRNPAKSVLKNDWALLDADVEDVVLQETKHQRERQLSLEQGFLCVGLFARVQSQCFQFNMLPQLGDIAFTQAAVITTYHGIQD